MEVNKSLNLVKSAIKKLYVDDKGLIDRNLCERCLVHRLAVYLEIIFRGFNVDCEFNKSFYKDAVNRKVLSSLNGNYVDIIVHKRSNNFGENLLCFEVKKASNYRDRDKDRENLKILTDSNRFGYLLGFYVILGKVYEKTRLELYSNGNFIREITLA